MIFLKSVLTRKYAKLSMQNWHVALPMFKIETEGGGLVSKKVLKVCSLKIKTF